MRKALVFLSLLVVLGGAATWLYFTPLIALGNMRDAAYAKNAGTLAAYVDFPSVRESLKVVVNAKVNTMAKDATNPMLALGAQFAASFVEPMIDNLVTPDNLGLMLSGVTPTVLGAADPTGATGQVETATRYGGLNSYLVTVKRAGVPWPPVELELRRYGVASWKLAAIRLP
jgi:hypothetical protein